MNSPLPGRHILPLVIFGIAAVAALAGAMLAFDNYEVVRKGQLLPYTTGHIHEIRLFDRLTFYVELENRVRLDSLNAFFLAGIGFISFAFSSLMSLLKARREVWFFRLMSIGMLYLAADEFIGIHETLGHNMPFLLKLPFVHRPDDVIIALYIIPALLFLYVFRESFLSARRPLLIFAGAIACFVVAAVSDLATLPGEELFEFSASLLLIGGTISLGLFHTTRAMESRPHRD